MDKITLSFPGFPPIECDGPAITEIPAAHVVIERYELPELPELPEPEYEDDSVDLVLFRFQEESITLGEGFTIADAQDYCSRDDTHGDGWFVGYRR